MSFQDKELHCVDCGNNFTFTAGEQEFYASRGLMNEPKRCPQCRQVRKADRGGGDASAQGKRQMFHTVCAECGKDTEVPFEPRLGKPVYCSDCFSKIRTSR